MSSVRVAEPADASDLPLNAPDVSVLALFLVFAEISLSSFGGAIAWARIVLVERRGWLGERQFAELLGLCQSVPGPSLVNMAIYLGTRHHGVVGAIAAASGFLVPPLVVLLPLGILYQQGAQLEIVQAALRGVAAAAAGMLLATGLKMAHAYRREPLALVVAALALVGVGVLRWPLLAVLVLLAPVSIYLAWRRLR
ncbi:MAG TPA: chromate transporter [Chloroflexota bacterium]|nr:chromate transporter [Chloroflexota bacterium]